MSLRKNKRLKGYKKKTKEAGDKIKTKAKTYVSGEDQVNTEAPERVTGKTVEEHREEILHGAKRFVYPLSHSKHRIAIISGLLFALVLFLFLSTSLLMLYRYQSTGEFTYRVTQIFPLPVAKIDGSFVSYEEYLFELRHNMHFYSTQEGIDFNDDEGQRILANLRIEAMERAKDNVTVRKLAKENGVSVSNEEIDEQIEAIRGKGGATESLEALENTLDEFYGWALDDWRRVLKVQLLKQKLTSVLDQATYETAQEAHLKLSDGADFGEIALEYSNDELTKENGGEVGLIDRDNEDLPKEFVDASFALEEGEFSAPVQTTFEVGSTGQIVVALHIIKVLDVIDEDEIKVAHVLLIYRNIDEYIDELQEGQSMSNYISLPPLPDQETFQSGEALN